MAVDVTWNVTSFDVTLLRGNFGWIRLMDGTSKAGYIYFTDELDKPGKEDRFGSGNYVVMHLGLAMLPVVMGLLNGAKPVKIRGTDGSGKVSTFFGTEVSGA